MGAIALCQSYRELHGRCYDDKKNNSNVPAINEFASALEVRSTTATAYQGYKCYVHTSLLPSPSELSDSMLQQCTYYVKGRRMTEEHLKNALRYYRVAVRETSEE